MWCKISVCDRIVIFVWCGTTRFPRLKGGAPLVATLSPTIKVTSPNFAKSFLATSILSTSDGDFIHHNFPLEIRRIPPIIQGNLLLLAASHQFPYLSIALSNRRESLYLPWCFRHTRNWTKHYLRAHATTTLRELSQSCRE